MNERKLERANFLKDKIDEIDEILRVCRINVRMEIKSWASNSEDKSYGVTVEREHQQEILDIIVKWRKEYQKEFEQL